MVAHLLAKERVASSNLVFRSDVVSAKAAESGALCLASTASTYGSHSGRAFTWTSTPSAVCSALTSARTSWSSCFFSSSVITSQWSTIERICCCWSAIEAVAGSVSSWSRSTSGSLVLNSAGRPPLKVTLTTPRSTPGGGISGYICAGLVAGSPNPVFNGLWPPSTQGFVAEGTLPATKAGPAPVGFVVPQLCAYVQPPLAGGDQNEWKVDCGTTANRDASATLGSALTQQGWTSCGLDLGTASWAKGTARLFVAESSLAPGDYPKVVQPVRPAASPSCP